MPLANKYSLKTAKELRPCFICGKFCTSVFDAPDDFFFVCLSHTKDSTFCTSDTAEPEVKQLQKQAEDDEIEALKREIAELKTPKTEDKNDQKEQEKESPTKESITPPSSSPRFYKLHRSFAYLREQELIQKEKFKLLKSLK